MAKAPRAKTNSRQLSRPEFAVIVIRALLATAAEGEIGHATVGRVVARIVKYWPKYSTRQTSEVERDWMRALKNEVAARDLGAERDVRALRSEMGGRTG